MLGTVPEATSARISALARSTTRCNSSALKSGKRGFRTCVLASAVADALQSWTGRRVTPVNARVVAQDVGLDLKLTTSTPDAAIEPEFTFEAPGETPHYVKVAWDRQNAGIVEVDRFSLERALSGYVLITHHHDQPGVVGRIGTILGRHSVNIAGMQVGRRNRGGDAIMVINIDDNTPTAALEEIRTIPGIVNAVVVSFLPPPTNRPPCPPSPHWAGDRTGRVVRKTSPQPASYPYSGERGAHGRFVVPSPSIGRG